MNWNSYADEFVSDQTGLDEKLIKVVTGNVAIDERAPRVFALTHFPDTRVVEASRAIMNKHVTSWPMERIIEQRHNVRMVPVGVVEFEYKEKSGSFFVYGLEHKVFFPDYPARCCCGLCTIM